MSRTSLCTFDLLPVSRGSFQRCSERQLPLIQWVSVREFLGYTLFYKQRFFSTQPQCCLNFSWIELQVLLRCCLIHSISILRHFIFTIIMSLSRPRSTYVVSMCSIFIFIFIMINGTILWIQIHLLLCLFLGGAPTSICHFFHPSIRLSVCPSLIIYQEPYIIWS